jgi:hypothetical protein
LLFPTIQFAIFFPIVLTISWVLMPRPRLWKPFILIASYIFYASAGWKFIFLLAVSVPTTMTTRITALISTSISVSPLSEWRAKANRARIRDRPGGLAS